MRRWTWITLTVALAVAGLNAGELLAGKPSGGGGGGTGNTTPPDIAYTMYNNAGNGGNELWVMQDDGTGALKVAPQGVLSHVVSWSPDGTQLAFIGNGFGSGLGPGVYVVNVDGTGFRRVTHQSGESSFPPSEIAWCPEPAPDGTQWLAFTEDVDPSDAVHYVVTFVSLDGTARIAVTPDLPMHANRWAVAKSWAPDGRRLLCANGAGHYRILPFSYDADGALVLPTENDVVDFDTTVLSTFPAMWANASDRLLVSVSDDLWVVDFSNPSSPVETRLTSTTSDEEKWATWSPDDSEVLFQNTYRNPRSGKGTCTLQIMPSTGGTRRTILSGQAQGSWKRNSP